MISKKQIFALNLDRKYDNTEKQNSPKRKMVFAFSLNRKYGFGLMFFGA